MRGCKSFAFTTYPTQAVSWGQARREQSAPYHSGSPWLDKLQTQLTFVWQAPTWLVVMMDKYIWYTIWGRIGKVWKTGTIEQWRRLVGRGRVTIPWWLQLLGQVPGPWPPRLLRWYFWCKAWPKISPQNAATNEGLLVGSVVGCMEGCWLGWQVGCPDGSATERWWEGMRGWYVRIYEEGRIVCEGMNGCVGSM